MQRLRLHVASARHNLLSHIKGVHDKIKDHRCDQCSFETSYRNNLHRHKMLNHKRGTENAEDSPGSTETNSEMDAIATPPPTPPYTFGPSAAAARAPETAADDTNSR